MNPLRSIRFLYELPPREVVRIVRGKLGRGRWRTADLLASAKHSRGARYADFLLRYQAILRRQLGWAELDFAGRRVVEIGCGPLAGFAPMAVFLGCARYESAEPEFDPALLADPAIVEGYLRPLHDDLSGLYGPCMEFDDFVARLRARVAIHSTRFDTAPIAPGADIVLSNSCLEHIVPLAPAIAKLAAIQTPATRFIHAVDFGNHYPTRNPFDGLYEDTPERYIARRGPAINLLRAPDIAEAFAEHGIAARLVPYRSARHGYRGRIGEWWRERYDDDALFCHLALVAGPAPE